MNQRFPIGSRGARVRSAIAAFHLPTVLAFPFFLFSWGALCGQELSITLTLPQAGEQRFSVCGGERLVTLDVENISGQTLSDVVATLDLSTVPGLVYTGTLNGVSGGNVTELNPAPPSFQLPNLAPGARVVFEVGLEALCEAIPLSLSGANPNFDVVLQFSGGDGQERANTGNFEVVKPALSIPVIQGNENPALPLFDAALGLVDTLTVIVANAGDGPLDSFLYFTVAHPELTLVDLLVGGQSLSPVGSSGDTTFFRLDSAQIALAQPGPNPNDSSRFQFNETLTVQEVWRVDACNILAGDLVRGVRFGCDGSPLGKCEQSLTPSGVRFGFVQPQLVGDFYEDPRIPCYADAPWTASVYFLNQGSAASRDLHLTVESYENSSAFDTARVFYRIGAAGALQKLTIDPLTVVSGTTPGTCTFGQVLEFQVDVPALHFPGDTLFLLFDLLPMQECNSCFMSYQGVNLSSITYKDACQISTYSTTGLLAENREASMPNFAVAPIGVFDGQTKKVTYTLEDFVNSWIWTGAQPDSSYPRSVTQFLFIFEKGLDWPGTPGDVNTPNFMWVDRQGHTWKPCSVQYTDNAANGPDTLLIEYCGPPPGDTLFSPAGNNYFFLDFIGDCAETGPLCAQGGPAHITEEIRFITDTTCTQSRLGELVACPETVEIVLNCTPCVQNPCLGLRSDFFDLQRLNLEAGDTDNDGVPEAGESLDSALVFSRRIISGDTIRATYKGTFFTDATHPQWEKAFVVVSIPQEYQFLPLGATLTITDADGGTYLCPVLQQYPQDTNLVINISPDNLRDLGNSAVPPTFSYQDGDQVTVELDFTILDPDYATFPEDVVFQLILTEYSFAAHQDWPVPDNQQFACAELREQLTFIRMYENIIAAGGMGGGCDLILADFLYNGLMIGFRNVDYFPYEYRSPKATFDQVTYVIPPGFVFDHFGVEFAGKVHAPDPQLGSPKFLGLTSPYIAISGDTVTFNARQYVLDNGLDTLPKDEGWLIYFPVYIRGACSSPPAASYTFPVYFDFLTNPAVFGGATLQTVQPNRRLDYFGGAALALQTLSNAEELNGETACFQVDVINAGAASATNTWLHLENPSGEVQVLGVNDITGGGSAPMPEQLGIYQLGQVSSLETRTYEICVSSNNCQLDSLIVTTGWDCNAYPTTVEEGAGCAEPDTLYLLPTEAELGMIILQPQEPDTVQLCDTVAYMLQLSSAKVGAIHDIHLLFELPEGMDYVPGSFQYAYPVPTNGADTLWRFNGDPQNLFGNQWQIVVSDLNDTLKNEGLPGTTQIGLNYLLVRFNATAGCGFTSGGAATFRSWAYGPCDVLTNYRFSPAEVVNVLPPVETYQTSLAVSADTLNPCREEQTAVSVSFTLHPNSVPTSASDSVRVIFPPGVSYVPGSYQPGANALPAEPFLETSNGQQIAYWDLQDGLAGGSTVAFSFEMKAVDAQQECRAYELVVQTFSSQTGLCIADNSNCDFRAVSAENRLDVQFIKPALSILSFSAEALASPPDSVLLSYSLSLSNGGESLRPGDTLRIGVYADDGDGDFGPADQWLFDILSTDSLPGGSSRTYQGQARIASGMACRLLAVVDPQRTCTCSPDVGPVVEAPLDQPFAQTRQACSGEVLTDVGPPALSNLQYEWLSLDGSNLGGFSALDTTPVNFQWPNTLGQTLNYRYVLRSIRGGLCYDFDTLSVAVFPEMRDSVAFVVCGGTSFNLSGPTGGSNYLWSPTTNLSDPTDPQTAVQPLSSPVTYTLSYTDANGCPATYVASIQLTDCANNALGDTVWVDLDRDGVQDATEPGLPGVSVLLYQAANTTTPIASTVTDADGFYRFDTLPFGNYLLRFVRPAGYAPTAADQGGSDGRDSDADPLTGFSPAVFMTYGLTNYTLDAGYYPLAAVGDFVWLDVNRNGRQDGGEPGIPDLRVRLFSAAGSQLDSTLTDSGGAYLFDELEPDDYFLQFVHGSLPPNRQPTLLDAAPDSLDSDADPADGRTAAFSLSVGDSLLTLDAGFAPFAAIGDRVWLDENGDGLQNPGEPGIAGIRVRLFNAADQLLDSALTAPDGSWRIDSLFFGSYSLHFDTTGQQSGFALLGSPQDQGPDDALDSDADPLTARTATFTFDPSLGDDLSLDAGFVPQPCTLEAAGLADVQCNDGGTPTDPADDFITFRLNPSGVNLGSGYAVEVSAGSLSPVGASYGQAVDFALQAGSAGAGPVQLTLRDSTDAGCTLTLTLNDPGACSTPCQLTDAGLAQVSCHNNGTPEDPSDDRISFQLLPTGTGLGNAYGVSVSQGQVSPTSAGYGAPSAFLLEPGSAGSGNRTLTLTDEADPGCTLQVTLADPGPCPGCPPTVCLPVRVRVIRH